MKLALGLTFFFSFNLLTCLNSWAATQRMGDPAFAVNPELICQGSPQLGIFFPTASALKGTPYAALDWNNQAKRGKILIVKGAYRVKQGPEFFLSPESYTSEWFKSTHPGVETFPSADPFQYKVIRRYPGRDFKFKHDIVQYATFQAIGKDPWAARAFTTMKEPGMPIPYGATLQESSEFNWPFITERNFGYYSPSPCGGTLVVVYRFILIKPWSWLALSNRIVEEDIVKKFEGLLRTLNGL